MYNVVCSNFNMNLTGSRAEGNKCGVECGFPKLRKYLAYWFIGGVCEGVSNRAYYLRIHCKNFLTNSLVKLYLKCLCLHGHEQRSLLVFLCFKEISVTVSKQPKFLYRNHNLIEMNYICPLPQLLIIRLSAK